jgi:DNA-binding NarL/FixJ family response regulator
MIKLLIVDDQKVLLDALTNALSKEKQIKIVGSLTVADVADVACDRFRPDMVLMDICTEGSVSGIIATGRIKEKHPEIKVMLMTGFPEMSFIERAKNAGADSFIYKDSSMDDFVKCIQDTMSGHGTFPQVKSKPGFGAGECPLTPRELEILRLFCTNHSRKEMATALGISTSTINYHINNMLAKTGYKNLMSLALEATNKGYIKTSV